MAALVKHSMGLLENIPSEIKEGNIYFTTDQKTIYVDINNDTRIKMGTFVEVDTKLSITDLTDTNTLYYAKDTNTLHKSNGETIVEVGVDGVVTAIANGGTGAITASDARKNLDVYSTTDVDTNSTSVSYETTLVTSEWQNIDGSYQYFYANANLMCGKNGNTPPIVTWTNNQTDYSTITIAQAEAKKGITFYASAEILSDISIIIIDVK